MVKCSSFILNFHDFEVSTGQDAKDGLFFHVRLFKKKKKKAESINKIHCLWTNRALTSCVLESGVPTVKKGKGDSCSYGRLFIARKEKRNNIYCISIVNWVSVWFLYMFHFMSSFLGSLMGNDWAEDQELVCCCRVRGWNWDFNTVLLIFNYTFYCTPCLSKEYYHLLFSKWR